MAIDTKRLRFFLQVAESGSLSKASEELHIAQPALSRQIKILEDYLGFPLFTRSGRGMTLTQEGRYLRDAVASPLRNIELAVENMRSFISRAGNLSLGIGIYAGAGPILTAPLVQALERVLPETQFRIMEGTSFGLYEGLKRGALDYVILDEVFQNENLMFRPLLSERLVLLGTVATVGNRKALSLEEFAAEQLVLPCSHQNARKIIKRITDQAKLSPHVFMETDSPALMLDLVQRNRGLALINESMAKAMCSQYSDLAWVNLDPEIKIDIILASRGLGEVDGSITTIAERTIGQCVKQLLGAPA